MRWLFPVIVVLISILLLQRILSVRMISVQDIKLQDGVLDMRGADVSEKIFNIESSWDFYPGNLYTSDDFLSGKTEEKAEKNISSSDYAYGTYRLLIIAPPDQYYTICSYSLDYATRVFVNGSERVSFGNATDNAEEFVPKIGYMTLPVYSGTKGEIEIIYQYANYVHKDGGYIPSTYISTPQNIEELKDAKDLSSLTLSGGMMILALYFLLSAAIRQRWIFLCLAFCCFLMAMRDQNFFLLHLLPPDTSWYFAYRMFIIIVMLMPVSILLMLKCLYDRVTVHWPLYVYFVLAAGAAVLICILPTQKLVTVSAAIYYLSIPYLFYLIFGICRYTIKRKKIEIEDFLMFSGSAVLLAGMVYEALMTGKSEEVTRYGTAVYGMLGFVLLNAAAINMQIQKQESALAESRSRNEALERMNRLNLDFLQKVAHELKTPLTVISGYAQLTGIQLSADRINEETPENLRTIQKEAQRLAEMVTGLMEYSYGNKGEFTFGPVNVEELLANVRAITAPMCRKNHNIVRIVPHFCGDVHGNGEILLQIFINLIVNANRNTKNGIISIYVSASEKDRFVLFRIEDTGSGIEKQDLPHIFEQGFSSDGSSGLGLAICFEAIEAHGGKIWVERTGPNGTVFAFTVIKEEG